MARRHFGQVYERDGRSGWYVEFVTRGRRVIRRGGPTRKAATAKLAAVRALLESGEYLDRTLHVVFGDRFGPDMTFRKVADLYLDTAEETGRKRATTLQSDRTRLGRAKRATWTGKWIAEVRTEDVLPWLEGLRGRSGDPLSGASFNRYASVLSAVFRFAVRRGWCESNPVRAERIERAKEAEARDLYLTTDEADALLGACRPDLRLLVLAALHTGARRGELLALRWGDVSSACDALSIRPESSKTGKPRTLFLDAGDPLVRELARQRLAAADKAGAVFVQEDGRPWSRNRVSRAFEAARAAARLPQDKRGLRFHDLRHSHASWLIGEGLTLFEVGERLGHKTPVTTKRYAHLDRKASQRAAEAVARVHRGA